MIAKLNVRKERSTVDGDMRSGDVSSSSGDEEEQETGNIFGSSDSSHRVRRGESISGLRKSEGSHLSSRRTVSFLPERRREERTLEGKTPGQIALAVMNLVPRVTASCEVLHTRINVSAAQKTKLSSNEEFETPGGRWWTKTYRWFAAALEVLYDQSPAPGEPRSEDSALGLKPATLEMLTTRPGSRAVAFFARRGVSPAVTAYEKKSQHKNKGRISRILSSQWGE